MERKVAIVGAGISGLLARKYALSKGYQPIVFESRSTIGGVWTKTVETTKLQTPKSLYQFTDFPWPSTVENVYPSQQQVYDYIRSYAKYFELLKHIKFNTKVVSIKYEGPSNEEIESWALWGGNGDPFGNKGKWVITLQNLVTLSNEVIQADFVILCIGRFSDIPNMPEFPPRKGLEVFQKKVIHSMDYAAMDNDTARNLIKDKRVTVVGFKKSALDIALQCSFANGVKNPCTVLVRTPNWNVPDNFSWGFPLTMLYLNRFSEFLLHKPGEGPLLGLLASLLSPLRWGISKIAEIDIKKKHNLEKFGMVPRVSFLQSIDSCLLSTVQKGFYDNVERGSIILKRSPSFSFYKDGIVLEGHSEPIKSDVVILATGFKGDQKLKDVFESPIFQDHIVGSSNKTVRLYRECIHPRIPQLAVIGFSENLSNLYTFELRCRWLMELLDGKFSLPSIQRMEKDVLEWEMFMKRSSVDYYRRSCVGALHIWYNDQFCEDMGWNPKRKKSFWSELFEPYGPMDYAQP